MKRGFEMAEWICLASKSCNSESAESRKNTDVCSACIQESSSQVRATADTKHDAWHKNKLHHFLIHLQESSTSLCNNLSLLPALAATDCPQLQTGCCRCFSTHTPSLFFLLRGFVVVFFVWFNHFILSPFQCSQNRKQSRVSHSHIQQHKWHQFSPTSHHWRRVRAHTWPVSRPTLVSAHLCISGFSGIVIKNGARFVYLYLKLLNNKKKTNYSAKTAHSLFFFVSLSFHWTLTAD